MLQRRLYTMRRCETIASNDLSVLYGLPQTRGDAEERRKPREIWAQRDFGREALLLAVLASGPLPRDAERTHLDSHCDKKVLVGFRDIGARFFRLISRRETLPKPPADPVPPRAYRLDNTGLPIKRASWYRYAAAGIIPPLLHIGGKTLVPAATIDGIVAGKIKLPSNAGHTESANVEGKAGGEGGCVMDDMVPRLRGLGDRTVKDFVEGMLMTKGIVMTDAERERFERVVKAEVTDDDLAFLSEWFRRFMALIEPRDGETAH